MMQVLQEGTSGDERCVYLPDQLSRVRYRLIDRCSPKVYGEMLERGWRRFGRVFFRPACEACQECRSLRLPMDAFRPNRSMRRTLQRNRDLTLRLQPVSLSRQHLELYDRYHADMAERKGWKEKSISPFDYYQTFVEGHQEFAHEILFFLDERLVAVGLVDILPNALSAVYCYYEPEERKRSLGVFSVLQEIHLAQERDLDHVYLGYLVEGNASMRYKARYHPHEILAGRPRSDEEPGWTLPETDSA